MNLFRTDPAPADYYARHKAEILKLVASEHLAKPDFSQLKYEFTGQSGLRWYSYSEEMQIPFSRSVKVDEYRDWLLQGVSQSDFDRICNEGLVCLAHIQAATKEAPERSRQLGLLLNELNLRRKTATPYGVLINLVAASLIREDETPGIFSSAIHESKWYEIQKEVDLGNNTFFLSVPQLKKLNYLQGLSPEELTKQLNLLQAEHLKLNQILHHILSTKDAVKERRIGKTQPLTSA